MASNLVRKWMQMSVRLRKLKNVFSADTGMHMNEIWVLGKIDNAVRTSGCGVGNTQIQKDMQITKSAVSQIIDSLVEKGYVDPARLDDSLLRQVKEAFFAALAWRQGSFFFYPGEQPVPAVNRVQERVDHLLLEGMVYLDSLADSRLSC